MFLITDRVYCRSIWYYAGSYEDLPREPGLFDAINTVVMNVTERARKPNQKSAKGDKKDVKSGELVFPMVMEGKEIIIPSPEEIPMGNAQPRKKPKKPSMRKPNRNEENIEEMNRNEENLEEMNRTEENVEEMNRNEENVEETKGNEENLEDGDSPDQVEEDESFNTVVRSSKKGDESKTKPRRRLENEDETIDKNKQKREIDVSTEDDTIAEDGFEVLPQPQAYGDFQLRFCNNPLHGSQNSESNSTLDGAEILASRGSDNRIKNNRHQGRVRSQMLNNVSDIVRCPVGNGKRSTLMPLRDSFALVLDAHIIYQMPHVRYAHENVSNLASNQHLNHL
uniref:Uncharacterized protein n=1 Tax=Glossina austeni TaxID=7395 RepID=A0A1A9V3S5_GLOAU